MVIEPRPKAKPDAPRAAAQTADRPCFCPHVYVGCPPLCLHCPFANREGVPTISEHGRKATFLRTITVYHRWKGTARSQRMKKPRFQEAKIVEVRGTPPQAQRWLGVYPPLGPGHLGVANVYCVQFTFVTVILIPVTEMGRCRTAHAAPGQAESPCAGPRTNPRPREPKKGRSRGTRKESPPTQSTTHSKSKSTERDTTRPAHGGSLHICYCFRTCTVTPHT